MRRGLFCLVWLALACSVKAGWLKFGPGGLVIQTFTTADPITGNNTGTITTNGNSYQFAGDNTGTVYLGGPGVQFRGNNDGSVSVIGAGGAIVGTVAGLATATNRGAGSLLLGNLTPGQNALITDIGSASLLLGAGTVSNTQAIVVGDGNVSHGARSVTADSFWASGSGFQGKGSLLTDLPIPGLEAVLASSNSARGRSLVDVGAMVVTNLDVISELSVAEPGAAPHLCGASHAAKLTSGGVDPSVYVYGDGWCAFVLWNTANNTAWTAETGTYGGTSTEYRLYFCADPAGAFPAEPAPLTVTKDGDVTAGGAMYASNFYGSVTAPRVVVEPVHGVFKPRVYEGAGAPALSEAGELAAYHDTAAGKWGLCYRDGAGAVHRMVEAP
jgi:hypothetical protein